MRILLFIVGLAAVALALVGVRSCLPLHPPPIRGEAMTARKEGRPPVLHKQIARLARQLDSRILRVKEDIPTPMEFSMGTIAVLDVQMLRGETDLISLRVDLDTGELLSVAGHDLPPHLTPHLAKQPPPRFHRPD